MNSCEDCIFYDICDNKNICDHFYNKSYDIITRDKKYEEILKENLKDYENEWIGFYKDV